MFSVARGEQHCTYRAYSTKVLRNFCAVFFAFLGRTIVLHAPVHQLDEVKALASVKI
jgi:hypothetical protein